MEDYSDSMIPPLTEFWPDSAIDEKDSSSEKSGRPGATGRESGRKEREMREKMTEMYSALQTIVPNLLPKATREEIVTDTIEYIQRLESEIERLKSLKRSRSPELMALGPILTNCTNRSSTVNVTISGGGVFFFGIQLFSRRTNIATEILRVFDKHETKVLTVTFSVTKGHHQQRQLAVTVTAVVGGNGDNVAKIKRDILNL